MSDLFRRQAIEHATRRLTGEVVLASPLSFRLLSLSLVTAVVTAFIFASLATYTQKEPVIGWIVPKGGLIRVSARVGGVVDALPTPEGQQVSAGAALAVLRLSSEVAGGDAGEALKLGLTAEAEAASAQAAAASLKLERQRRELVGRRAILTRELAETRSRVEIMQQRQRLADDQVERGEKLQARGFLAPQQLDQIRSTALGAAQDASQTRAAVMDLQRQIGDLDEEVAAVPADLASVRAQAAQSSASLSQRRTTNETQARFIAAAPISGRLLTIPVELGQSVPAGATVAVMTPTNSDLIAELYAPSRAAGFIQPGQEVRLMYQAFPFQTFGTGRGVISTVSRTVLAPSEVAIPGLTVQEPVFRIRVRLDHAAVRAYGRSIALQPGMLLNAEIVTQRRNLLQWLLDPLYAAGHRT